MKKYMLLTSTIILGSLFSVSIVKAETEIKADVNTEGEVSFIADENAGGGKPTEPGDGDGGGTVITPPEGGSSTGALRFEYVPNFKFGEKVISASSQSYPVQWMKGTKIGDKDIENYPQFLQVTDETGSKTSEWGVGVKMTSKFTGSNTADVLDNTYIMLHNVQQVNTVLKESILEGGIFSGLTEPARIDTENGVNLGKVKTPGLATGTRTSIVFADPSVYDAKIGSTEAQLNQLKEAGTNAAVTLDTPSSDIKTAGETYKATLTWELSATK